MILERRTRTVVRLAALLGAGLVLVAGVGACRQPAASPPEPAGPAGPPGSPGEARCGGAFADAPWLQVPASMGAGELAAALRDRPAGAPVRLDLAGQARGDAFVIELAGSDALAGVRELGLAGNGLGPEAMRALAGAPGLDCLQRLDASQNAITDEGFALLCTAGTARDLRELVADGAGLTGASLARLPGCVWRASLQALSLAENDFSAIPPDVAPDATPVVAPGAAQARAAPAAWSRLASLDLSRARCRVPCLTHLRDAGLLAALQRLQLEGLFGPAEARVLAAGRLDRLTSLRLIGMADLSEAESDVLGDAGLELLIASPMFAHVEELVLPLHGIGDGGAAALAASPHGKRLRRLDLRANAIGDDGARALVNGAHTRGLMRLDLSDTLISDEMADTLRAHYGPRVLLQE